MTSAVPSVFNKTNVWKGKILRFHQPANWSPDTLLLRVLGVDGLEIPMFLTGGAIAAEKETRENTTYDFIIDGATVKQNRSGVKQGIQGPIEIRTKYTLKKNISKSNFPTRIKYDMVSFIDLAQKNDDEWLDIVGVVAEICDTTSKTIVPKDTQKPTWSLRTRLILLQSGEFHEEVELAGNHCEVACKIGDTMAFHGGKLKEVNHKRRYTTGLMTVIEVNPGPNETIPLTAKADENTTTRKATCCTRTSPLSVSETLALKDAFVLSATENPQVLKEKRSFQMEARIAPLDDSFFACGQPFFGTDSDPLMRIRANLQIDRNILKGVTIWDAAARSLFALDAATLIGKWNLCADPAAQTDLLQALNACGDKKFRLFCSMKLWSPSDDQSKISVSYHVHQAEKISS